MCVLKAIVFCIFISFRFSYATVADSNAVPGEISKKMCKKYAEYVPDSYKCPFSADMIVGSTFATRQEFPHMVMLGNEDNPRLKWVCGGSLISEQFVLTAAHCLKFSHRKAPVMVRIGVTDLNDTDHLQDIKIKEIILHPQYKPSSFYNDIGLVRLEKKININNYARPACLFTKKEIGVEKVINSGWGPLEFLGEFDNRLQKITLEVYTEEKCNGSYHGFTNITLSKGVTYDKIICAGTKSNITIRSFGGGPLLVPHKEDGIDNFTCISDIVGVASFGISRDIQDWPEGYTRVSAYISWIEGIVWN